eukprot:jgi/Botrbrau1/19456/Bobra.0338s0076.1
MRVFACRCMPGHDALSPSLSLHLPPLLLSPTPPPLSHSAQANTHLQVHASTRRSTEENVQLSLRVLACEVWRVLTYMCVSVGLGGVWEQRVAAIAHRQACVTGQLVPRARHGALGACPWHSNQNDLSNFRASLQEIALEWSENGDGLGVDVEIGVDTCAPPLWFRHPQLTASCI